MSQLHGGRIVAKALKNEGVSHIFTLCGGHVMPIYDGCLDVGIRVVDTRHEQTASHAADGWARVTGEPGVAVVTAGPGLTDAVTGVASAWRATAPALERAGYTIDQSDKSRGIFYLHVPASAGETQKRGVLSKLKFWGGDEEHELQLNLTGVGTKTEAVVLDREGRWETGDIARKILERLEGELEAGA